MKKIKLVLSVIVVCVVLATIGVVFANTSKVTINATQIDLYFLDDSAKEYGVTMPAEYKDSYQLKVTGTNIIPDYTTDTVGKVILKISEDGLISARKTGGEYIVGECVVTVSVGNQDFEVKVNVHDYLDIYVENLHKEYIKTHITDDMTQYEKMEEICKYVAQYEYNTSPDYRYLSLLGGGDCIASSHTIIKMSELVGIDAYERYEGDGNGGLVSNHRNVSALLDGKVYEVEAGYNEPAPRTYSIEEEPDGFRLGWEGTTDYPALTHYDGFEENVVVPNSFTRNFEDGDRVFDIKVITKKAFSYPVRIGGRVIREVTLPEKLEKISEEAFADCKDLTTINIPATLKEIGEDAFDGCTSLVNINIDPANEYFSFEDGILYNKDKTEVIFCTLSKKGKVKLDDNVRKIDKKAFYEHTGLTAIELGPNVETIEKEAFSYCNGQTINIPASVNNIADDAFAFSYFQLVTIEDGCSVDLDKSVFVTCTPLTDVVIPASIENISEKAFYNCKNVTYHVEKGSKAEEWAKQNSKPYDNYDIDSKELIPGMVKLMLENYTYDGNPKTPDVRVVYGKDVLQKDKDYKVEYKDNVNASSTAPTVIVKGIGSYSGTVEKTFAISKQKSDFTIDVQDSIYGQKLNIELIGNNSGYKMVTKRYNTVKSTSGATTVEPTDVGEYYVCVSVNVPNNYNYGTRTIWAKFNILQAENQLEISCGNVLKGGKPKVNVIKNLSGSELTYYYKGIDDPDTAYSTTFPTELGKYTVKVVSAETKNYKSAIATTNFEVIEASAIKGDMNKDGSVNSVDAALVLDRYTNKDATEEDVAIGDMDEKGDLNATDAALIIDLYSQN